jgi:transcriptional regulator with XRE-family HTH domain
MTRDHTVDVHVGARMRQRRVLLGMSQSKVGDAVGLTFQQIQKYECGSNRIGSSRLYEFAGIIPNIANPALGRHSAALKS